MKRIVNFAAVLLFVATMPAFALQRGNEAGEQQSRERRTVVDEVIRMSHAGLGDEEIIAFIQQSRGNYVISADEMIAMAENKVSRDVMKAVIHEAADRQDVYAAPSSDTTRVVVEHEPYYDYPRFSVGIGLYAPYYYGYYGYPYYGWGYPYYGYGYYSYRGGYYGHGHGYSHGGGHGYRGGGGGHWGGGGGHGGGRGGGGGGGRGGGGHRGGH